MLPNPYDIGLFAIQAQFKDEEARNQPRREYVQRTDNGHDNAPRRRWGRPQESTP